MHPFFVTCTIILAISISSTSGQDQGGGSTQVTGLRLKRETEERDLKDLNAAISTQAPGRGRKRRQLFGIKPTLPISAPSLNLNSITNTNTNTNKNKNNSPSSISNPVTQLTNSVSSTTDLLNKNNPLKLQAQSSPSTSTTSTTVAPFINNSTTSSEENESETVTENTYGNTGNTENPAIKSTENPRNATTTENENTNKTETTGNTNTNTNPISGLSSSVTGLLNKAVVKPVSTLTKTTYVLLTDVQRKFVKVNQDFFSALNFYNSDKIQNNPVLKESVIVKQEGVECVDVCDPQGPGFGLLGLCTPNYCTCFDDKTNGTELSLKEKRCRDDQVFDPHPAQLSCRNPADTVLCGDSK